jgi:hypothetical protein
MPIMVYPTKEIKLHNRHIIKERHNPNRTPIILETLIHSTGNYMLGTFYFVVLTKIADSL